ncbi:MAG: adenine phosphoribosyltransferase [Halanaerobiales bacterium]
MELHNFIREISDFPEDGILFKDITPLLRDAGAFKYAINSLKEHFQNRDIDFIAGIESRGFIVGTPLALALNKGFIPIRKSGKLPHNTLSVSYSLEYGTSKLEIHRDAVDPGDKILLVDDLLATGGTVAASAELIEELDGEIVSVAFLLELTGLNGREKLEGYELFSLLKSD